MRKRICENCSAYAMGIVVASSSYAILTAWLPSGVAEPVSAVSAICFAGIVPTLLMKKTADRQRLLANHSMSQRLFALNSHAIVNVTDENGIITEVNEQLLSFTGYRAEDLIGRSVSALYHWSVQDMRSEIHDKVISGEVWQGETLLRHRDGAPLNTRSTIMPLFDETGACNGSIAVRTDTTHAHELLAGHETAQTLFELQEDIWIVDSETEDFTYMNRAALKRTIWDNPGQLDKKLSDLTHDAGAKVIRDACRELKKSGEVYCYLETTYHGMPAQVSIRFLPKGKGPGRYLVLINDISERIEQEPYMAEFVSVVSHELRSPLTSIKGAMGLLLSNSAGDIPAKAKGLLEIAHRNADRLILIINDILDLEKISTGQMDFKIDTVDLSALVHEADRANAMLQRRFGVRVQLRGVDDALPFPTDPNRFLQVLNNLLSNAYKFSSPAGAIIVDVHANETQVRVSVKDKGPGIPREERQMIFERFADLQNSARVTKGGTGLGLSICKAIVETLGGSIGFDTEEGVGTTFHFTLPREKPAKIGITDGRSDRAVS